MGKLNVKGGSSASMCKALTPAGHQIRHGPTHAEPSKTRIMLACNGPSRAPRDASSRASMNLATLLATTAHYAPFALLCIPPRKSLAAPPCPSARSQAEPR